MGIGIVALGLWLLLGLKIHFQSILLFPPILCLVIIFIGLWTISKHVPLRHIKMSLILLGCYFIYQFLPVQVFWIEWLSLLLFLFFLFKDIEQCATSYPHITRYHKIYQYYLICLVLALFFSYVNTYASVFLYLSQFLMILSLIYLCFVIYHLLKINAFLEEKWHHYQISYAKKNKIFPLFLLSCLSIYSLILIKEPYEQTIQDEVIFQKQYYFKIDKEDYKLLPFGYSFQQTAHFTSLLSDTYYYPIRIFIHQDLITSTTRIRYTFYDQDDILLRHELSYDASHLEQSYDRLYTGYIYQDLTCDIYEDLSSLDLEHRSTLSFKLELIDEDGTIYYQDDTPISPVLPKSYSLKSNQFEISSLQYDMHVFLHYPEVQLTSQGTNIKAISIFEPTQDIENENPIYYYDVENNEFLFIPNHRLLEYPVTDSLEMRIVCYDKNHQIIQDLLCPLEEEQ